MLKHYLLNNKYGLIQLVHYVNDKQVLQDTGHISHFDIFKNVPVGHPFGRTNLHIFLLSITYPVTHYLH